MENIIVHQSVLNLTQIISQGCDISVSRIVFVILIFIGTFTHMCLYCILGEILVIQVSI